MFQIKPLTLALHLAILGSSGLCLSTVTYASTEVKTYSVGSGSLSNVLSKFAQQSGVSIMVDADEIKGINSNGIQGAYSIEQGFAEIFKNTNYNVTKTAQGYVLVKKPVQIKQDNTPRDMGQLKQIDVNASGSAALDPNVVQLNPIIVTAEDDTVTENSGSYTTKAMSVATKMATSLKDTPRSVSVISNQQLKDQGLEGKNLEETLRYTPGITLDDSLSWTNLSQSYNVPKIYSRGQQITNLQIDGITYDLGGANASSGVSTQDYSGTRSSGLLSLPDMILFDHVEIVRGPNSVFSGNGSPSATINMVKKRPLKQQQVILEGTTSSWDSNLENGNYRATLDVSSPIPLWDERLRVRLIASQQDGAASFQDYHKSKRETLYGAVEFDLTSNTIVGLNYNQESSDATGIPIIGGFPRYHWGDDIGLPVRTNITSNQTYLDSDSQDTQIYIKHKFNDSWSIDVNAKHINQELESRLLRFVSTNVYEDNSGASVRIAPILNKSIEQDSFDIHVNGSFKIYDRDVTVLAGMDYKKLVGKSQYKADQASTANAIAIPDITNFDRDQYYWSVNNFTSVIDDDQYEKGFYGSIKYNIFDPVNIIVSARKATYKNETYTTNSKGVVGNYGAMRAVSSQPITPTYSITYDLNKNLTSYFSYSESYQDQSSMRKGTLLNSETPNVLDSYVVGSTLDPITGKNYELGLNAELFDNRLNAYAVIYYMRKIDIANYENFGPKVSGGTLDYLGYTLCCYSNTGTQESKGIDIGVSGEIYSGLQINAGYTYNKNETKIGFNNPNSTTSSALTGFDNGMRSHSRSPEHQFKFFASYQPKGRLEDWRFGLGAVVHSSAFSRGAAAEYLGYDANYVWDSGAIGKIVWSNDSYYANGANGGFNSGKTYTLPFEFTQGGYATWNGMIDWQATKNLSLTFNANNIFDKRYYRTIGTSTNGNYYGEPRNFSLTARLKF